MDNIQKQNICPQFLFEIFLDVINIYKIKGNKFLLQSHLYHLTMGYGMEDRGSISVSSIGFFSSAQSSKRPMSIGGCVSGRKAARA
jgi:hypothetical protein